MTLSTPRLVVRPFLPDDFEHFYAYASLPGVMEACGSPHFETREAARAIFNLWSADEGRLALALRETGRMVGYIAVKPDSEEGRADTRELGFALHPAYHRRGLMGEAVRAVTDALFARGDIAWVWACCFETNAPSRKLIEKCGFAFVQRGTYPDADGVPVPSLEYRMGREEYAALPPVGV